MKKILITRKELREMISEALPGLSRSSVTRPSMKRSQGTARPGQGKSYTRDELKAGLDTVGDEPSDVLPSSNAHRATQQATLRKSGRVKYTGNTGKDMTASSPYDSNELAHGDDVAKRSPGIVDSFKKLFTNRSKQPEGFENAPEHLSRNEIESFHRDRAIKSRDRAKQYGKMHTAASEANDEKKRAYAKKMHAFYASASNAHERALKGIK